PVEINLDPLTPIDNNRLVALNGTVHQEWYFNSFSADGTSDITIVSFHQPGSPKGGLFVMLDAIWSNGTRSENIIFVQESQVITCAGQMTGIWSSTDQDITFTFTLNSSLKRATITAKTPSINGEWNIKSTTSARYPSGNLYPSRSSSLYFAPYNWWEEAIPSGIVSTVFEIEGSTFSFNGFGGHETFVTTFSPWNLISKDWIWARMVAGPYTAVVWYYNSPIDGERHVSAFLSIGDAVLFSSPGPNSAFTLSLLHNGGVSDNIINNSTGYGFDFVQSSGEHNTWHFEVKHNQFGLQAYSLNSNYTRFVDTVSGG
ncbi:hypothetical protein N431DRAFT_288218, partial [Stipitochalara longipes BDJ]